VIGSRLLSTEIRWPGIPSEHAKPFANVEAPEDLFSWAALAHRNDPLADIADGGEADFEGEEDLEDE
jgi:hypothetical protein